MTNREATDATLADIRHDVARMSEVVSDMIRLACDTACQVNSESAAKVLAMDDEVDNLQNQIIDKVCIATMRIQPVATDLKFLAATLGVVGEIEKAGDDAVKLTRRATKLTGQFPAELKRDLAELGEKSRLAFVKALKLYLDYSDELAQEVIEFDHEIDRHFKSVRAQVVELLREQDPERTRHLIRVIDAFHCLEHAADHAVEIAKRLRMHFSKAQAPTVVSA